MVFIIMGYTSTTLVIALLFNANVIDSFSFSDPWRRNTKLESSSGLWAAVDNTVLEHTGTQEQKGFQDFDFKAHWYPVVWEEDLIPHQPTRVTVFDED